MTNNTLFPTIPTPEQIARYKAIHDLLNGYREGTVTMAEVKAIPKEEIQAARDYISQVSFSLLEADIPGVYDGTIE